MIQCPKCNSKRIFHLRIDSDWTTAGDYYPANERSLYSEKELQYDTCDKPDINIFHCLDCHILFE